MKAIQDTTKNSIITLPSLKEIEEKAQDALKMTPIGMVLTQSWDPRNLIIGLTVQKALSDCFYNVVEKGLENKLDEVKRSYINSISSIGAFWIAREVSSSMGYPTTMLSMIGSHVLFNLGKVALYCLKQTSLVHEISKQNYTQKGEVVELTDVNYIEEINQYDGPLMIDAYSVPCPPCKVLEPLFNELSAEYGDRVKFAKFNAGTQEALSDKLEVYGTPSIVLMKNGQVIDKISGLNTKEVYDQAIQKLLAL